MNTLEAATAGWLKETEADRVERWRTDRLVDAGYPAAIALTLACDAAVDLHTACSLLTEGCDLPTALRILT